MYWEPSLTILRKALPLAGRLTVVKMPPVEKVIG